VGLWSSERIRLPSRLLQTISRGHWYLVDGSGCLGAARLWYLCPSLGLQCRIETKRRVQTWGAKWKRRSSAQGSGAGPLGGRQDQKGQKGQTKRAGCDWRSYGVGVFVYPHRSVR
jgi:hypothetical protein